MDNTTCLYSLFICAVESQLLSFALYGKISRAKGYSVRNLKYMAKFAARFSSDEIVQAPLAQITWYHHIALMDKTKESEVHIWYAEQAAKNGWSRNVLVH